MSKPSPESRGQRKKTEPLLLMVKNVLYGFLSAVKRLRCRLSLKKDLCDDIIANLWLHLG